MKNTAKIDSALVKLLSEKSEVYEWVSMAKLSRWKVGGEARCYIEPCSLTELSELVSLLAKNKAPYLIVGGTTNILFDDGPLDIVLIKIGAKLSELRFEDNQLICQAGCWVPAVSRFAAHLGFSGLEHICGIPGTIGGLVYMNGGSLRKEIGSNVVEVRTIDPSGEFRPYKFDDCKFSYRTSVFQEKEEIVAEVVLKPTLIKTKKEIKKEMLKILQSRRKKFPGKYPNCGSVFLSDPVNYQKYGAPGAIIERLGLKGISCRGAKISDVHANFIVNDSNAKAEDILKLIAMVMRRSHDLLGINMNSEVLFVSRWGQVRTASEVASERFGCYGLLV